MTAVGPWVGAKKMVGGRRPPCGRQEENKNKCSFIGKRRPYITIKIGPVDIYLVFGWGWGHEKVDSILVKKGIRT